MRTLVAVLAMLAMTVTAHADVTGKTRVIDGDTIEVGGERVRLHGIDAPEARQTCTANGKEWACEREATFALAYEVGHHWVTCRGNQRDRYGRLIAFRQVGPYDLGERKFGRAGRWCNWRPLLPRYGRVDWFEADPRWA